MKSGILEWRYRTSSFRLHSLRVPIGPAFGLREGLQGYTNERSHLDHLGLTITSTVVDFSAQIGMFEREKVNWIEVGL